MTPPTPTLLRGPVPLVHQLLRQHLVAGNRAIDATCGNGKDTLCLARLVGETGMVWGFDIQETAIDRTAQLLTEQGVYDRVHLVCSSHEAMAQQVESPIDAIVFNLGWLPGGNPDITTTTLTTLAALDEAKKLLAPGGILLLTCYPGHPAGRAETEQVRQYCSNIPGDSFFVWEFRQLNVSPDAPFTILIQRTPLTTKTSG